MATIFLDTQLSVQREIGEFHSGWPCAHRRGEAGQEGCPNGGVLLALFPSASSVLRLQAATRNASAFGRPWQVRVDSPSTPSSGLTAGGSVHVVRQSGPQGKAEGEAMAARHAGERLKSLGTSFSWIGSNATLRCCCGACHQTTAKRQAAVRLRWIWAGGTPRAPPSSRKLFGRTPSAKKTTDRFLQRTLLCLQWPRWWRGVAALPVHVITVPSPAPPDVAALAHILDDSDPCSSFDEDSFEDVRRQWQDTSWF